MRSNQLDGGRTYELVGRMLMILRCHSCYYPTFQKCSMRNQR
jgi:hypothetical protein